MKTIRLMKPETRTLLRPIRGSGGHQDLLRELLAGATTTASASIVLHVSPEQEERIRRYADAYGDGGYQRRFRIIVKRLGDLCG